MKLIRELNEGAYKDRQNALQTARKDFKGFMEDFLHDGILEMLLADPKSPTALGELRHHMTWLKRDNPEAFAILKAAFTEM